MKNRNVGFLIIGIAVIIGIIIFLFNSALTKIADMSCSHGPACSMYGTINTQTYISFGLIGLIIVIGVFLIFLKEPEKIIEKIRIQKVKEKPKPISLEGLDEKEKKLVKLLQENSKAMFQADLMEKLEIGKVGMTRMLDKLEAKQIIERKRRGMNNIVVLKG